MHERRLIAPYVGELETATAAVEKFRWLLGAPGAPWGYVQKALFEERSSGIAHELKNISTRVAESVGSTAAAGPATGRAAGAHRPPRCHAAAELLPARFPRLPARGAGGSALVFDPASGSRRPGDVYAAAKTNEAGAVECITGPFASAADATSFVAGNFGGQGYAVPFELAFRRK